MVVLNNAVTDQLLRRKWFYYVVPILILIDIGILLIVQVNGKEFIRFFIEKRLNR